jgi:hypothetical protein
MTLGADIIIWANWTTGGQAEMPGLLIEAPGAAFILAGPAKADSPGSGILLQSLKNFSRKNGVKKAHDNG